jgi:hypothetical protein
MRSSAVKPPASAPDFSNLLECKRLRESLARFAVRPKCSRQTRARHTTIPARVARSALATLLRPELLR